MVYARHDLDPRYEIAPRIEDMKEAQRELGWPADAVEELALLYMLDLDYCTAKRQVAEKYKLPYETSVASQVDKYIRRTQGHEE